MEPVLRQELVEVVPGHTPRNLRIPRANQVGVSIAEPPQRAVYLRRAAAGRDDAVVLLVARPADAEPQPFVGQDFELLDVVDGLAAHDRMHAARLVADHAAEGAVRVRRRIGRERQAMAFRGVAKIVEDQAGLDARKPQGGIERHETMHVLRVIEHDGDVAALASEARAAAAREDGRTVFAANRHRRDHIVSITGNDDANRHLPVVRGVGRVKRAAPAVESHLAAHGRAQVRGEIVHVRGAGCAQLSAAPATSRRRQRRATSPISGRPTRARSSRARRRGAPEGARSPRSAG